MHSLFFYETPSSGPNPPQNRNLNCPSCAQVIGLKSKSHGKGEKRRLVLSRLVSKQRDGYFLTLPLKQVRAELTKMSKTLQSVSRHPQGAGGKNAPGNRKGRSNWPPKAGTAPSKPAKVHEGRQKLPSFKVKDDILAAVGASQVLVLTGETGCGKTTQVPQFIAEEAAAAGKPCYIVCTQPRRLAAISVAQRVADERGTGLGSEVGYNVRLDSKYSAKTHMLFVTSGLFLKMLIDNPLLTGITHLIVDEVRRRLALFWIGSLHAPLLCPCCVRRARFDARACVC